MFNRYAKVSADGVYTAAPKKLSKFKYISMMVARVSIVDIAYSTLAQAVTVAVRFSAVRRQGFKDTTADTSGGTSIQSEHVVLDYQMQQYRIFKALSLAYCLLWNKRYIVDFIRRVKGAIEGGDESAADGLPELHATLSGLKASSTVWAHAGIEDCRKCCGGQGFLKSSGIARLSPNFSEWVTVEGEQVILSLQCARFLIKAVGDVAAGRNVAESARYLRDAPLQAVDLSSAEGIVDLLKDRARRVAVRTASKFSAAMGRGLSFDAALNSVAAQACKASECHVGYFMMLNNLVALGDYFGEHPRTKTVMRAMLELHGLIQVRENLGDWVGLITDAHVDELEDRVAAALSRVRPEAVGLVDAFGFLDSQLDSTLGRADGNVYEAIYDAAKENPLNLNDGGKMVGWDTYAAVLDLDFLKETEKRQRVAAVSARL